MNCSKIQKFASGDESLEVASQSGRSLSLNDEDLRTAIETNSKLTCRKLATTFNVSLILLRTCFFNFSHEKWQKLLWTPNILL